MAQELKIRISNHKEIEEKLHALSADYLGEENFVDTYFNRLEGIVFKISTNSKYSTLLNLRSVDGKFEIISSEKIENVEKAKNKLVEKYGIKKILKGVRKYYYFSGLKITLCLIEELGEFLILTGENSNKNFIAETLAIKNPEYIRVSFDELKAS